jgi:hypothetical protein
VVGAPGAAAPQAAQHVLMSVGSGAEDAEGRRQAALPGVAAIPGPVTVPGRLGNAHLQRRKADQGGGRGRRAFRVRIANRQDNAQGRQAKPLALTY